MRFAIAGCDRYIGIFESFLKAGWEPLKLFVVPASDASGSNASIVALAAKLKIDVQLSRMTERDLQDLGSRGCEALVVASYDWRIGDWPAFLKYAVNFHCSPLPVGRGPYPTVRAILENRQTWGITCHRIEPEFDTGAILAQELFPMSSDESHESLELRVQMAAIRLANRVGGNFIDLWQKAAPQGEGSYWKKWTEEERTIDFSQPVDTILRHIRAFGLIESVAKVHGSVVYVRRAAGWTETHHHAPGTVVHVAESSHGIVIAVPDGYVALIEWSQWKDGAARSRLGAHD